MSTKIFATKGGASQAQQFPERTVTQGERTVMPLSVEQMLFPFGLAREQRVL